MTDKVHELDTVGRRPSELERNRAATNALSVVARRLRFSPSRRSSLYAAVGLRPRLVDRVFSLVKIAIFLFVLVAPNVLAVAYFGLLASDQYNSETRFTVRSSMPTPKNDKIGDISGIPSAKIAQDTQIVTSFIVSPAMLAILEKQADFVSRYSRGDADWYARLPADATAEKRLKYWKSMVSTKIEPQSGIVTVDVRAFSAEDAQAILTVIVKSSEKLINDLNDRIWADVTRSAQAQVERATAQLAKARSDLQDAQNKAGILSVQETSTSLSALLTQVEGEKISLENTYRTNSATVSTDAPQMKVLARQIASKQEQIEALRAQIAGEGGQAETLADTSSRFSQLTLERQLAEQQLAASITALEQLHYSSQQQLMYLEGFLAPTLPDDAEYPRRELWIGIVFAASILGLVIALGLSSVARTYFD